MPGHRITLQIEGAIPGQEHVRLVDFLQQLTALRNALRKTEETVAGTARYEWQVVDLSHGSPATVVIEAVAMPGLVKDPNDFVGLPDRRDEVVSRFFGYMHSLTVKREAPEELSRSALIAFKELAVPVSHDRVRSSLRNGTESIEVDGSVQAVVDAILAPKTRESGTVEGRLEFINIHGGRNIFRIYPIVGPERVECSFPDDLLQVARESVGRAVRVSGELTFHMRDPFPHSIKAEEVETLPDDKDLPSLFDIRGMAPRATGGRTSEDFVSILRADE
jgi:hypothetical protein